MENKFLDVVRIVLNTITEVSEVRNNTESNIVDAKNEDENKAENDNQNIENLIYDINTVFRDKENPEEIHLVTAEC